MNSNIKEFVIASVSDVHLGHKRVKTADTIAALDAAFPDNAETANIDLLVIVGDLFDRLLNLPEDDVSEIQLWAYRLLCLCAKHKIVLRVLEGTPRHDWKQSAMFETLVQHSKLDIDFKYIRTVSIEYMEKFGINVLYVEDEHNPSTAVTLEHVKELMAARNLDQVDYAFMHGQFEYQLTAAAKKAPRHDSAEYMKLVKHYIFIGHIHTHTTLDRILAQGSFPRLGHGEEGPKGHIRAIVTEDDRQYFFIENKMAKIYKTLKCEGMELQEALTFIKKAVKGLPVDAAVRIKMQKGHPLLTNMNLLATMYPTITWSKDVESDEKPVDTDEDTAETQAITIDKSNIVPLLMDRVKQQHPNAAAAVKRSEQLLLDVI